jgi:hypothetical protein|tara:strand:+ start:136 stop:261 length:126 start_codon:yes stop_codon:yes gene_type:complete
MHKSLKELFLSFDPKYKKDKEDDETINQVEVIEDDDFPLGI